MGRKKIVVAVVLLVVVVSLMFIALDQPRSEDEEKKSRSIGDVKSYGVQRINDSKAREACDGLTNFSEMTSQHKREFKKGLEADGLVRVEGKIALEEYTNFCVVYENKTYIVLMAVS